ncbi:MAG: TPM domain-containing protein, partial [Acidobacteriota bacterium]
MPTSSLSGPDLPQRIRLNSFLPCVLFVFLLGWTGACPLTAQVPDQKPRAYINDYVGILSAPVRARLEAVARELDQKASSQIVVVIVNSLEGEPIENFSLDLATRWGIGSKERGDTGALLLLAIQDRENRIEVGYGLEPILPDGRVGAILRDMRPHLQAGDYDSAIMLGFGEIAGVVARENQVTLGSPMPQPASRSTGSRRRSPLGGLIRLVFLLGFIFMLSRPRRRRPGWHGSGVGRGLVMGGLLGAMLGGGMRG